jgi:uncharacterized DUF497 family protein
VSFEWDSEKARTNARKHDVHFADAVAVFEDENALTLPDEESEAEERFVTLGRDGFGRVLVVVYTWRAENIRVVSARRATKRERATYES